MLSAQSEMMLLSPLKDLLFTLGDSQGAVTPGSIVSTNVYISVYNFDLELLMK